MLRLVTALVLLPLLYLVVGVGPLWLFFAVGVLAISQSCFECYRLLEARGGRPFTWIGLAGCWGVLAAFFGVPSGMPVALPLAAVGIVAAVLAMWRREDPPAMLDAMVHTIFPLAFVGWTLAHLLSLRVVPGLAGSNRGELVMFLFLCTIAADTAAYYVGTAMGRHRMAPRISPKKSWEGVGGGIAGALAGAVVGKLWLLPELPWPHTLGLAVLLGFGAVLGDLAASVIKRASGAKDFSALLPGHGGMLDRMDSLLFSAPVLYYYYVAFLEPGL